MSVRAVGEKYRQWFFVLRSRTGTLKQKTKRTSVGLLIMCSNITNNGSRIHIIATTNDIYVPASICSKSKTEKWKADTIKKNKNIKI